MPASCARRRRLLTPPLRAQYARVPCCQRIGLDTPRLQASRSEVSAEQSSATTRVSRVSMRWTRPAERTNARRKDRGIGGGSRDTFVVSPERFAAEQPVFVQIISERSNQMRLRTIAAAFVVAAPLLALAKSPGRSLLGNGLSLRVFVRVFLALSRLLRWRWSPPGWLRGRGLAPWLRIPRRLALAGWV